MSYSCECCSYKCMYPKDLEKHNLTNKHQKNMKKQEIKCDECIEKDVLILELRKQIVELQQAITEMKMSPVQIVPVQIVPVPQVPVQPVSVQPVKQVKQVKPVQPVPESKPERITEKFLTENYTTTIDEFLNQVIFEEEEVHELMKNPFPDKLMLKKLKEMVENTDMSHRGFVTTDTARKKMWILHKNKWEVSSTASMYIKRTLRKEISKMLCTMTVNENGDLLDMNEIDNDTYMNMVIRLSNNDEWEQTDTSIMEMFSSESS